MGFSDWLIAQGYKVEVVEDECKVSESLTAMFRRKSDGKVVIGPVGVRYKTLEDLEQATDESRIANLREQGYDIIRLVKRDENIVSIGFENNF